MSQKPKIYVFCNGKGCDGRGDWHVGMAVAEDGTGLACHLSSNHSFVRADLGNQQLGYQGFERPEYHKHYPDGYEVVWVEGEELDALAARWAEVQRIEPRPSPGPEAGEQESK